MFTKYGITKKFNSHLPILLFSIFSHKLFLFRATVRTAENVYIDNHDTENE